MLVAPLHCKVIWRAHILPALGAAALAASGCVPTAVDGGDSGDGSAPCRDCQAGDGDDLDLEAGVASAARIDPPTLSLEVGEIGYLTMWLIDPYGDLVPTSAAPSYQSPDTLRLSAGGDGEITASDAGSYQVTGKLVDDDGAVFEATATVQVAAAQETGGDGGGGDGGGGDGGGGDGGGGDGGGCDKWQGDGLCHAGTIGDKHCTGQSAADPGDYMRCDADGCGVKWTNIGPCPDGYFP